jgi:choline transporter-like protein 2/4/5
MMRFCAGFFVWLTVLLVIVMLLIVTFFCAYKGALINNNAISTNLAKTGLSSAMITSLTDRVGKVSAQVTFASSQVTYWSYAAYIFIAIDVLVLLLLIFMCSRIKIAVGIIREASKALTYMPFLVLFPIVPTVLITVFVIYWIITAAYLASSGSITVNTLTDTINNATGQTALNNLTKIPHMEFAENNALNYLLIYHLLGKNVDTND